MAAMPTQGQVAEALEARTPSSLRTLNAALVGRSAEARIGWALSLFGERIVLASSFGAQAAVMLHLVTRQAPGIPVVLIDTGYLFAETYRFVDALTARLSLNLQVYSAALSPAWQEARYGRLWEQGAEGLERYHETAKIAPMRRALSELGADAWFAGLRRGHGRGREGTQPLSMQNGRLKIHPIVDWSARDVHAYLTVHDLPYHPLWHQGYESIGDWHSTHPVGNGTSTDQARFHGLKLECGLHESA